MSKSDNISMADYILSGGHEENNCKEYAVDYLKCEPTINKSQLRKYIENHIWFIASKACYGLNEANKLVTELMKEVIEEVHEHYSESTH